MYTAPAARRRGRQPHAPGPARGDRGRASATAASSSRPAMAQPEAMALYESHGWHRITPYGHYKHSPQSVCFAKELDPRVTAGRHAVLVGATASGKSALALALARRDPDVGARVGRLDAGVPGHGHRHRQAHAGRAGRGAAPPARPPRPVGGRHGGLVPARGAGRRRRHRGARPPGPARRAAPRSTCRPSWTTSTSPASTRRCAPSSRPSRTPPRSTPGCTPSTRWPPTGWSPANRRRVVRALEVTLGSGRPFSSYGPGLDAHPPTPFTMVGLRRDVRRPAGPHRGAVRRPARRPASSTRCRRLHDDPRGLSRTAAQALGYKELHEHLTGEVDPRRGRRPGRPAHRPVRPPPVGLVPARPPHHLARPRARRGRRTSSWTLWRGP